MELNKQVIKKILLVITFTIGLYFLLMHPGVLSVFFGGIFTVLMPFILGLCFAFVLNVLLRPVERFYVFLFKPKETGACHTLKRPLCIFTTVLIVLGALFLILWMVIPEVSRTAEIMIERFPDYMKKAEGIWKGLSGFFADLSIKLPSFEVVTEKTTTFVTDFFSKNSHNVLSGMIDVVSGVINVFLGLIFCFYILARKEKLGSQSVKLVRAFLPEKHANALLDFCELTSKTFSRFVAGQVTEAIILGILCFIGMKLFFMPYAPVIATLVGFTALIPVVGAFFGTAVGALLIFVISPLKALWFIAFIIVLQQLEENLIYPRVVGRSVGLPALWVLLAITAGGSLFGIVGMLFAVPVTSVIYTTVKKVANARLEKKGLASMDE